MGQQSKRAGRTMGQQNDRAVTWQNDGQDGAGRVMGWVEQQGR